MLKELTKRKTETLSKSNVMTSRIRENENTLFIALCMCNYYGVFKERSHITKFSPIFYLKILARYSASYCLALC